MAIKRIRYKDNPLKVNRTAQEKLATFGTTREEGDRYMAREYAKSFETFGPAVRGTATIPDEPQDMLYADLTALPPFVDVGGESYPLPLAVITEIINRSSHRVITRNCSCRTTFDCQSYDKSIGCLHIGAATAEEPESVARHVSKEEAIEHVRYALSVGLLPYVGKLDYDNEFWGIWSGEPMFTVCLCCPCCCITRHSYTYLHPVNKPMKFNGLKGLRWKIDPARCLGDDCGACVRHCVGKALHFEDGKLRYTKEQCILCGECMSRCMRSAISIETDDLEATINNLVGRYDGQCGDLGFQGEEYAKAVLRTTPFKK